MNEAEYRELLEIRRQRELTPAELHQLEQWLAAHQEHAEEWEEEDTLSKLIGGLPDAEISSNFTSQVWQKIELDAREREAPRPTWLGFLRGQWLRIPRLAWAVATLLLLVALVQKHEQPENNSEVAEALVPVSELVQVPTVEMLQDFDAINAMAHALTEPDMELLAVLEGLTK
ncbi:MAG: hypothetical protein CMO80_04930 [Verrucomicrobiales bacterium]|nr:hypothetical protein [Verrucomicrobiales bacterium]|tara:strand:+ start:965 stop:1483 length:519 start_codon:yes stop_codon:yes gene_type:complete